MGLTETNIKDLKIVAGVMQHINEQVKEFNVDLVVSDTGYNPQFYISSSLSTDDVDNELATEHIKNRLNELAQLYNNDLQKATEIMCKGEMKFFVDNSIYATMLRIFGYTTRDQIWLIVKAFKGDVLGFAVANNEATSITIYIFLDEELADINHKLSSIVNNFGSSPALERK